MFGEVFRFELHYRLRQPVLYVFAALFFFMTFMATSTDSFQIGGGIGNVARNAPFIVARTVTGMALFAVFVVTILMASVIVRDRELGMRELLYSTPLRKLPLLAGRFSACVLVATLSVVGAMLGIALASLMPWQNPEHIQPFSLTPYLYTLLYFVVPNLFLAGAIFFSVSTLTGRALFTYVAMVGFFALYGISYFYLASLENQAVGVLLDPFGLSAFDLLTRYWTVAERNTILPSLAGPLLVNRLIWISVGLGLLIFTMLRFRMVLGRSQAPKGREAVSRDANVARMGDARHPEGLFALPSVSFRFDRTARLRQWVLLTENEVRSVLRSIPFLILVLFGVVNLIANLTSGVFGSNSYPVTHYMIQQIEGGYVVMLLIIIVFYSAELIWRERKVGIHEIQGALPVPNGLLLCSKFAALIVVILVTLTVAMLTAVAYQAANGYFHFEPLLYIKGLYIVSFSNWVLLAALAVFTQVVSRQRYVGFFLVVLYFLGNEFLPQLGLEHHLYFYRTTPQVIYSDMNGYGHFAAPLFWFNLYWAFMAAVLLLLASLLWPRGSQLAIRPALTELRRKWTRRHVVAFVACGLGVKLESCV